ncbi:MAG TPA: rhodanese-like domain-containing protein [Dehalococcoidia bacterium]|nr:rhodanese-like domain-containing protein [Dehalococcoidia bacterium]
MPTTIDRNEVQRLRERGVPVVEVLPSKEYEEQHLAGAINIPLRRLDEEAPVRLRRDQPVVVYCNDAQ